MTKPDVPEPSPFVARCLAAFLAYEQRRAEGHPRDFALLLSGLRDAVMGRSLTPGSQRDAKRAQLPPGDRE